MAARAQGENGHAESIERIQTGLSEPHQLVERKSDLAGEFSEVTLHHFARKRVVTRGNRGMGREDVCGRDQLERGIKIQALLGDVQTNALQRKESRMPFVHVENL